MRAVRHKLRMWNGIALATALSLAVGVVGGFFDSPKTDPESVVERFAAALTEGDVSEAAELTSYPNAAKAAIDQAFDGLDAERATFEVNQFIPLGDDAGIFNATADWTFGNGKNWQYNINGRVRKLSVGWRVSWQPQILAPGLGGGRTLRYDRTDAAPPRVFDIAGNLMMTEQRINTVTLDPGAMPDPVFSTNRLAKVIEPVAPLITGATMMQELAAAPGQRMTAVSLRDDDFAVLEDDLRAIPGVVIVQTPKLISHDRRIAGPLADAMRDVWQLNRDATAGWAVNAVAPDGSVVKQTGYQGPPGPDIRSALDPRVQMAAMEAAVTVGTPAAVVAIQPSTGAVLAAAQNNQASEQGPIAFTGLYPAGSALAAVDVAANAQHTDQLTAARQLGLAMDYQIPGLDQRTDDLAGGPDSVARLTGSRNDEGPRVSPFGMALVAASVARGSTAVPVIAGGQPATTDTSAGPLPQPVTDQLRGIMRDTVVRGEASLLNGYPDLIGMAGAHEDDRWFFGSRGDLAFAVFVQDADGADRAVKMADRMLRELAKPQTP
ncbi:NTF2-like N-terminal transpeptidase domain-containing protein [Rhodococcus sp. NPDC058514]|uniref:NTF2-like N-terminal transpeptidase domain-containing protein n=1 Tax=unclassified Rhodococcus (in: high G+C Gram-positive bacteria) TaxID=192944 RepID=UPI0036573DC7